MRLFFALRLPEDVRERLRLALEAARRAAPEGVGFTRVEQLHFTLAFLGETERVEEACAAGEGVREQAGFELAIAGSGAFPSPSRPRVLWLGATEGGPELVAVADRLCAGLRERGFSLEDRPFRPHLTVGRVRPRGERDAHRALGALPAGELARFDVGGISLMRSELGKGGAKHFVVKEFALKRT